MLVQILRRFGNYAAASFVGCIAATAFMVLLAAASGNISWTQLSASSRHGTGALGQSSDGTGVPGHYATFKADGSVGEGGTTPVPPNPPVGVLLTSICAAGSGGNDTTCLQTAINQTAGQGTTLEIAAASSGHYNTGRLVIPSGANIILDSGADIKAITGLGDGVAIFDGDNAVGVTITGTPGFSVIEGLKSEYTSGESRHCMRWAGATNVTIDGISCNNSGGDGIYIGEGTRGYAQGIEVKNSTFNNNSRNAMSIISCDTCNIHDDFFTNTIGQNGAASGGPAAGIDIEPNVASNRLVSITLTNNHMTGNGDPTDHTASDGNGITVHFDLLLASGQPVSISGSGNTTSSNVGDGIHVTNEHDSLGVYGPSGTISFTSHTAASNGRYGAWAFFYDALGPALSITGSTFTNNNVSSLTADSADFGIERGGGDPNAMGNVTFTGNSITSTNGHLVYYFTVADGSSSGLATITIGSFGTTTGASGGTKGIQNGTGVNSVSIP